MEKQLKMIISLLIKKTKSKHLSWKKLTESSYYIDFNDCRVNIFCQPVSYKEKRRIRLLIYNSRQEVISTLEKEKFKDLKELYELAHNNYYSFDETLEMIIRQLA